MDFILGMLGIAVLWLIGSVITYVAICAIINSTKGDDALDIIEKNKTTNIVIAIIVGLIFVLALFAKRMGFL